MLRCGILFLLSCSAGVALAENPYIYNELYNVQTDSDRNTPDNGAGLRGGFGWHLKDRWYAEITIAAANLDTGDDANTDFYQVSGGVDVRYELGNGDWRPFLLGGGGIVRNDAGPGTKDVDGYLNAGVGLLSPKWKYDIRMRAEARAVYDNYMSGLVDWHIGLGFMVPLGVKPAPTAGQVREVVVEKIVYVDRPDADNDGVPDDGDSCPDSMAGTEVDASGCVKESQVIRLDGVNFEFDSARLTGDSTRVLDRAAALLSGQLDLTVEIAGHTDSMGSDEYNKNLSQARANSVRSYLMSVGVGGDRMTARGYGESEPIATNSTIVGRSQNRRVEFRTNRSAENDE